MTSLAPILGFLGIAITALGAFIVGNRRLSGRIASSEASSLWTESASIRTYLAEQLEADRKRITDLEARVATAEAGNIALARENLELIRKLTAAEGTIGALRDEVADLRRENDALRNTIRKWASDGTHTPPGDDPDPGRLAD